MLRTLEQNPTTLTFLKPAHSDFVVLVLYINGFPT